MLKAGALYFAIVIAFFIAIISASLIILAAHYRSSYMKEVRFSRLTSNLDSGIAYVLADSSFSPGLKMVDLYGAQMDSLWISRKAWGIFDLAVAKVFILEDTLKKSFLIGAASSDDSVVLCLSDEDRPLSLSMGTRITGDVALPKAGVKQSYVEGKPYKGDRLIYGKISNSNKKLDPLNKYMVKQLKANLEMNLGKIPLLTEQSLSTSFFDSTLLFKTSKTIPLENKLTGNIILYSDTTVVLTASSRLDQIQVYAPFIKVENGFSGSCQLFARDSIVIGNDVKLDYPSVLGVIRTRYSPDQPKISVGNNLIFKGIMFSYEDKRSPLQTMIILRKDRLINGEIYCNGTVKIEKGLKLNGKISCNSFMMQTQSTLYENVLVDVILNRKAISKYYLTSRLFKGQSGTNQVLKWLK